MTANSTVYVVDDDFGIRDSLTVLLKSYNFTVFAYGAGMEFLSACDGLDAGCLLLDVRIPDINGLDLLEKLGNRHNRFPAIIMTGHADVPMAVRAMKAGAIDFVEKPFSDSDIVECVNRALAKCAAAPVNEVSVDSLIADLTPREKEVLDHLVLGKQNKVIAYDLGISTRTVEIHRAQVMRKMRSRNVAELVRTTLGANLNA